MHAPKYRLAQFDLNCASSEPESGSRLPCALLGPKRPPTRLGEIKTGRIVNRAREVHELGGDPAYERFPASEEMFLVPDHAHNWAVELKQPKDNLVNVVCEARCYGQRCGSTCGSKPTPGS